MKWLQQRWVASGARRRELRALRALGESLPANGEIVALDEQEAALHAQVGVSLERDQDEYALVHAWARPLVVLRGLLDRVKDDDAARQQYVDLLELLGPEDPRTPDFRRQLTARLY